MAASLPPTGSAPHAIGSARSRESTRAFAGEFYHALANGVPIDACVTEGRRAVMNTTGLGRPDWGIPTVYTRARDGRLFELPPLEARAAGAESVSTVAAAPSAAGVTKDRRSLRQEKPG